jgi:hypothetical protein
MVMFIKFADRTYDFDWDAISIDEWREMKRKYKMNMRLVQQGAIEGDPDAVTCAYWAMLRQNGELGRRPLNDDLKPEPAVAFVLAFMAAMKDEQKRDEAEEAEAEEQAAAEAEAAENPTQPRPGSRQSKAPSTRTAGTTAQSQTGGSNSAGPASVTVT